MWYVIANAAQPLALIEAPDEAGVQDRFAEIAGEAFDPARHTVLATSNRLPLLLPRGVPAERGLAAHRLTEARHALNRLLAAADSAEDPVGVWADMRTVLAEHRAVFDELSIRATPRAPNGYAEYTQDIARLKTAAFAAKNWLSA